jgi:hypothetical protein
MTFFLILAIAIALFYFANSPSFIYLFSSRMHRDD